MPVMPITSVTPWVSKEKDFWVSEENKISSQVPALGSSGVMVSVDALIIEKTFPQFGGILTGPAEVMVMSVR